MLLYDTARNDEDLSGILALQKRNLPQSLSPEERLQQGFVTVSHSLEQLRELNRIEPHVIARDDNTIAGYLLAMTPQSRDAIPILVPMFDTFDQIMFGDKAVSAYRYIVVGQVCIDAAYRGQGVLDRCYESYRDHYRGRYDFAITEIDARNGRSLNAHKRIGFKEIHRFGEWVVVLWDWTTTIENNK